ncbi:hypothetical protein EYF80_055279 [Liparis tanakae]|uniref:Uncharacterized protein n=1 Tax=Liparis tanakae TaxID=230148 RepID=A0A4Z2F0K5_9TELE|nr:hypothetical protein EYF80_055279 [Liparis tanakae]
MSQEPGHSRTRHSFIRVRATTFDCPKGSHRANLSRLRMTSSITSPEPRLHVKKSVSTAPWFWRMNFSITDSMLLPRLLPRLLPPPDSSQFRGDGKHAHTLGTKGTRPTLKEDSDDPRN